MHAPLIEIRTSPSVTPLARRFFPLPELLEDQPPNLPAVRPALGLAHDVADDGPHRLLLARADLVRRLGIGLDRRLHDGYELVAAAQRAEVLGGDDRLGVAAPLD